ncbi:response regulator [Sphingomonas sp. CGMCC 1.13654]|uniref:histidine kinase n=1 Tax=Sphingomonas chungangi TaxID=2683589 RepID=A0A838L2N1_9SPHN|nr:ATP-binding protein [Sphingomonas chungangi]MBA2932905.1 response regulator [Sphingomonas chungangi]MVW56525.1 response regulator [Sphingomonas chungangi]
MTSSPHRPQVLPFGNLDDASAGELSDIDLLHRISVALINEQDRFELYGKIVEAAVAITGSQFGTMQLLCPADDPSGHGGELQLLAHRGLPPEAVGFWQWVSPRAFSSCTLALKFGQRAIVPDFEEWDEIAGTPDLAAFRSAGIRSAQTTPLLSRSGKLLGMISNHWSEPHEPSDRDLRMLDIVARQAADILDRTIAEETLRQLNETLEVRVEERSRELMASEDQVRQLQKMEAIGQLTGGVAHDFNNLLTIIRSSAELLSRRELPRDKQKKYIDAIAETADRAAKLTSQLLAFARRQALKPEVFNAATKVGSVADMLRTVVGSRVDLVVDPICASCFVEVDASQFETALVNMAVNARDAMNGEGRITIAIEAAGSVPARRGHAAAKGDFVKVSVTDTGSGMASDQLERIFEPFFTTKEVGKGTGLGLSQVYGFTKQSGGEIDVDSRLGEGTTFSLYLPRTKAPNAVDALLPIEKFAAAEASILIVEDNDQVGEFASHLLGDMGFMTRRAANAREAIVILEREHDLIDIVFSDVIMPGMDGVELGRQVRRRWPELTVVLTSGYSHVLADDARHGFALLHKPYSVDELSRVLRDARQSRGR